MPGRVYLRNGNAGLYYRDSAGRERRIAPTSSSIAQSIVPGRMSGRMVSDPFGTSWYPAWVWEVSTTGAGGANIHSLAISSSPSPNSPADPSYISALGIRGVSTNALVFLTYMPNQPGQPISTFLVTGTLT